MRRTDREITDIKEIYKIMKKCEVCDIAFFDDDFPYIIPLNFGVTLKNGLFEIYLHGAGKGKKIDLLNKNNHVGFAARCAENLILDDKTVCKSTMEYESVCGNGIIKILPEEEKAYGLTILMNQYLKSKNDFDFDDKILKSLTVMKIEVSHIYGKKSSHRQN